MPLDGIIVTTGQVPHGTRDILRQYAPRTEKEMTEQKRAKRAANHGRSFIAAVLHKMDKC